MNFKLYEYYQFDKLKFFNFLKNEFENSQDTARINIWNDQWQEHKNTLPYILEFTGRFKEPKGQFHILTLDNEIIGCGGVYISDFHDKVSLCATRLWMSRKHRNNSFFRETIFPAHKKWSIEKNCKIFAFCFNEYNKALVKTFLRKRIGEAKERIKTRQPYHLFYNGVIEVEFPVKIQNTQQWVIYEKLDDFEFDWNTIRYL
jgi:hypothetical protein